MFRPGGTCKTVFFGKFVLGVPEVKYTHFWWEFFPGVSRSFLNSSGTIINLQMLILKMFCEGLVVLVALVVVLVVLGVVFLAPVAAVALPLLPPVLKPPPGPPKPPPGPPKPPPGTSPPYH